MHPLDALTIQHFLITLREKGVKRVMDAEYETETIDHMLDIMSPEELATPISVKMDHETEGGGLVAVAQVTGQRLAELDAACFLTPVDVGRHGKWYAAARIRRAHKAYPMDPDDGTW